MLLKRFVDSLNACCRQFIETQQIADPFQYRLGVSGESDIPPVRLEDRPALVQGEARSCHRLHIHFRHPGGHQIGPGVSIPKELENIGSSRKPALFRPEMGMGVDAGDL